LVERGLHSHLLPSKKFRCKPKDQQHPSFPFLRDARKVFSDMKSFAESNSDHRLSIRNVTPLTAQPVLRYNLSPKRGIHITKSQIGLEEIKRAHLVHSTELIQTVHH